MDIQKYKDRLANGVTIRSLLEMAFVEEEGLIDYIEFLGAMTNLSRTEIDIEVSKFLTSYNPLKDYFRFKKMVDAGASFEEIAEILGEGICVICQDAWIDAVDLLMKLFKLSYEEASEKL